MRSLRVNARSERIWVRKREEDVLKNVVDQISLHASLSRGAKNRCRRLVSE